MKHIMISDHDLEMFKVTKQALKEYYRISSLSTSLQLQEHLSVNQVDLVILMVSAENTCDFKTFHSMNKIPEMIGKPVIFLGKSAEPDLENRALTMGAEDFIPLPVTPELLLHKVSTCLELMSLRKDKPYVEKYQDAISVSFAELVEFRDPATGGHLKNTTKYFNILLNEALKSDRYRDVILPEDTRDLLRSVTLHDIGKIGINDDILRKSSSLDHSEFEYMKTHTVLGKQAFENVIRETGGVRWLYLARDMAYCHHEHWDGTGYPNGLKGEEIPLCARMLAIVDVYDALTSNRAYKQAYSHERTIEIIEEGRGSLFDPELVDLFMNAADKFEKTLENISGSREKE